MTAASALDLPAADRGRLHSRRRGRRHRLPRATSASTGPTCRRCSRRRRAPTTATTSSTTRASTPRAAARRASTGSPPPPARPSLGILVDIVPNHVGVAIPRENPWWWDVLQLGRDSPLRRGVRHRLGGRRRPGAAARSSARASTRRSRGTIRDRPRRRPATRRTARSATSTTCCRWRRVDRARRGLLDAEGVRAVLARQHYELRFWRDESGRAQLPPVLRGHDPRRRPRRGPRGVRRVARRDPALGRARASPTACASTTRTVCSTPAATSTGSPRRPAAPTCWSRRSSSTARTLPAWWRDRRHHRLRRARRDRPRARRPGRRGRPRRPRRAAPRGHRLADAAGVARPDPRHEADDRRHDPAGRDPPARARLRCRRRRRRTRRSRDALAELLACFPVYRSYLPAGREHLEHAAAEAAARRPDLADDHRRARAPAGRPDAGGVAAASSRPPGRSWRRASRTPRSTAAPGWARSPRSAATPAIFSLSVDEFHRASRCGSPPGRTR